MEAILIKSPSLLACLRQQFKNRFSKSLIYSKDLHKIIHATEFMRKLSNFVAH